MRLSFFQSQGGVLRRVTSRVWSSVGLHDKQVQGERGAKKTRHVSSEVGSCSWVPFYMTRGNMGMFKASETSYIDIAVGVKTTIHIKKN